MNVRGGVVAAALLLTVGVVTGCSTLLAVRGQQERAAVTAFVSGTVSTTQPPTGPLIVGILARGESGETYLLDHFVAEKPGPYVFAVAPGKYWLGAFEDVNRDGNYEDEPALRPSLATQIELAPGQRLRGVDLVIPFEGRFARTKFGLADLQARSPVDQQRVSAFALSVDGEITTLDDKRFARKVATDGLWKFYDFILTTQPGIYFLEEYDPKKIPVLFVHGIGGTPREFRAMIAALDHTRFQPWVYYYPSGMYLEYSASLLTQLFVRLRVQYGFKKAAVVAHSMGGLVSRQFVLQDYETSGTEVVRTFVTIASPLGGMESAGKGVESSPIVVHAWEGLAPGSQFLEGLYYSDAEKTQRRKLPKHVDYHLLFGFIDGSSSDGVVALSSQLRGEAQQEARTERGFEEGHRTILKSPAVAARLNEILTQMR
jgi:pimeloyl-ACP methyl ester carboxylesterase